MSGHSKWNNIKGKKAVSDAKKSKEFTTVARLIRESVRHNGSTDPNSNSALRLALEKARSVNVPSENIKRAIERGSGKSATGGSLSEVLFEGYGPHGVGFLVLASTDNHQRTTSELRFIFSSHNGSLASPGAAAYLFTKNADGYIPSIPLSLSNEEYADVLSLLEELEAHDDAEGVWHNAQLSE